MKASARRQRILGKKWFRMEGKGVLGKNHVAHNLIGLVNCPHLQTTTVGYWEGLWISDVLTVK